MDYLDFELSIGSAVKNQYPVKLVRSPGGEARASMRLPFDEQALENKLQALEIALLRSGGKRRRVLSLEEQTVQNFGQTLFSALLTGEVLNRYDVSLQKAKEQDKGLRLKLHIQSAELATLPWEYLYDKRSGKYVVLSRETPLIRYLELQQTIEPLAVTPPLRILGMVASPTDLVSLDAEHEKQRVEEAIRDLKEKGIIEFSWLAGETWEDLQREMRRGPWHVFHFIGHCSFDLGSDEGLIALANKKGEKHLLTATQLGLLLANHRALRMVLLNACEGARGGKGDLFSSSAATLVRRGIPAVIAMQHDITDRAAAEFSHAFYAALADGMPVDSSITEARVAMNLATTNSLEWGTPVLYSRAPDGVLFTAEGLAKREDRGSVQDAPDQASTAQVTGLIYRLVDRLLAPRTLLAACAGGVGLILLVVGYAYTRPADPPTFDINHVLENLEQRGYTPNPSFSNAFQPGNIVQKSELGPSGEVRSLTSPIVFASRKVCFPDREPHKQNYLLPVADNRAGKAPAIDPAAKIFPQFKLRDASVADYRISFGRMHKFFYERAALSRKLSSECVQELNDAVQSGDSIEWFSLILETVVIDNLNLEIKWEPKSSSTDRSAVKELALKQLVTASDKSMPVSTANGAEVVLDNEERTVVSIKHLIVLGYRGRSMEPHYPDSQ